MIRTGRSHLITVAQTHPGMSGKNNEDRFAVSAYLTDNKNPRPVLLAVLSDGIGGHRAGEVAAEIAVNRISQEVALSDGKNPVAILQQAIVAASAKIFEEAQQGSERHGMGATCVVALVIDDQLYAATVGDSRLYLVREGQIHKLSTDHTWIQEALDAGMLMPDQVEGHPNAHVIRRYLGSPTPPQVDIRLRMSDSETNAQAEANQGMQLLPNDCLLLCSDGLSDLVKDQEILEILQNDSPAEAVKQLIERANELGGHDNITAIAVNVPEKPVHEPQQKKKPVSKAVLACTGVVMSAALLAGLVWGGLWLSGKRLLPPVKTTTGTVTITFSHPAGETGTFQPPATGRPVETGSQDIFSTPRPVLPFPVEGGSTLTPWPTNTYVSPSPKQIESTLQVLPPAKATQVVGTPGT